MRKLLVFVLLGICIAKTVCGQVSEFDPKDPIQNISLAQWTAEDGLSSNNLTHVFQDSKGLLWITSFNGVMIFDGERVEIYDINNLDLLETDGFYTVTEDSNGIIYLGSQGSGIIKYKNGVFSKVVSEKGHLPKSVPSILVTQSGPIYIGSNNQGIFKLSEGNAEWIDVPALNKSTVSSIKEDSQGRIWVATEGQGLFCLKNDELERHISVSDGLHDNYVESIAHTDDGLLMIATTKGLQYVDASGVLISIEGLTNVYINYLFVDQWNSVWAGAENGLARWSKNLNKVDWVFGKQGIDLVRLSSIMMDRENSLWLTSSRMGLVRLKESKLTNLTKPHLSSNRINIIHESWDGKFYIGTDQNQLDVYKGDVYEKVEISTDLGGNGVRDIYHDDDGSFWLATYVGIIHKVGSDETVYSTDNGMPANNFRLVIKDKNGVLWFGSRSGGLVKFKNGEIIEILNNENKLESNFILSLTESSDGKLLIGTHSGGLSVLSQSGEVSTFHLKEDDAGVLLFNIDLINDTEAIVTANVGLLHFDSNRLEQINLSSDRRSKTYFDLVDDGKDNFWVTTNLGVLQMDKADWNSYINNEIEQIPYTVLDENSGMNNKECTGATRSLLTSQGKIMVPTLGGVCQITPDKLQVSELPPDVLIRNVIIDEVKLPLEAEFSLVEAGALRYIFEFAAISYTAPERNQFSYILEGFEKEWSNPEYSGRVEYTNLPPGKYTFKVKGANESHIWNENPTSFSFTVEPFFYQTLWFYLLLLFLIIGIFLIIYKWRISFINRQNIELKKVNAELDRFVYSASHEIRSPLSSILGLINLARMGEPEKQLEYYDHIEKSVNRLDDFIHDIVDYSRNARLGIEVEAVDFEKTISNILEDISHTQNFGAIQCDVNYDMKSQFFSDPKRLKIVLSNIITNAFKHHQPDRVERPYVSINVEVKKNLALITVKDNGPGIENKHMSKVFKMFYRATTRSEGSGLGLYIVEETLAKLQGSIVVKSKQGKGSTFKITVRNLKVLQEE
ncbi:two-component regulator propeller domain-containing protein [Reichenbachiella sp.]|uniref:sensor histidine kinase n=1 Tax=Reichenbachiella sp. TaxID=2184521 RepID=UPI003B5BDD04